MNSGIRIIGGTVDWNELLSKAKAGDEAAKRKLYSALRVFLARHISLNMLSMPSDEAEDIIEKSASVTINRLDLIEANPQYSARRTLGNAFGDYLRKKRGSRKATGSVVKEDSNDSGTPPRLISINDVDEKKSIAIPSFEEDIIRRDWLTKFRREAKRLSKFCQLYLTALFEDRMDELLPIFQRLFPASGESAYYTRLNRCREKFGIIYQELEK